MIAVLQVTVRCDTTIGQVALQSRLADMSTQTTHLRGSITGSLAVEHPVLAEQPSPVSRVPAVTPAMAWLMAAASNSVRTSAAAPPHAVEPLNGAAGSQQTPGAARGGCLAAVDTPAAQSGAGSGYRLHPAIADSAMHTGALRPAAPRDGLTRVPVALGAYTAGGSCSARSADAEAWASADTGAALVDKSRVNTYR